MSITLSERPLLLVDDEPSILRALKRLFVRAGYHVTTASSAAEAVKLARETEFPVVVSDFRMPQTTGAELLEEIKAHYQHSLGILLTGYADLQSVIAALNSGAVHKFYEKPWNDQQLLKGVETAFELWRRNRGERSERYLTKKALIDCLQNRIYSGQPLAVVYLDIKRFSLINESLGYQQADELLRYLAGLLLEMLPANGMLGQMNGDEFVLVIPGEFREADVVALIDQVLQPFRQLISFAGRDLHISFKAGYTLTQGRDELAEDVMRKAQTALNYGKNRCLYHHPCYRDEMARSGTQLLALQSDLYRALERDEFSVFYQPKICLQSDQIIGAEALIRWQHRSQGLISPAQFIPLAESSGLIEPIGEWVLSTASAQSKVWQLDGLPPFVVSVNLSGRQLMEENLVAKIQQIIQQTELPPEMLELEVTETFLMQDIQHSLRMLHQIKQLGVRIAIDDFGTGYSSLSYLAQLPADTLKVDRSFITPLEENPERINLVRGMIRLSHDLGMRVVAEGVENRFQLELLRELGCDEVQGFYFSPAVNAAAFRTLLERQPVTGGNDQMPGEMNG